MAALIDDVKVKTNLTATTAPTINDDSTRSYSVFSPWVDVTANRVYFCADPASGAAVWREVIGGRSGAALTLPEINDTSEDHQYVFAVNELVADRTVTLPLLTGNDVFVFEAHAQTLTNKTIDAASNTLTLFAGGANNRLLTDNGSGGLVSESGLIFDGTRLGIGTSPTRDLTFSSTNAAIVMNTVDASDTKSLSLAGGGNTSASRGARIELYGNEYATVGLKGRLNFISGNAGNATQGDSDIDFQVGPGGSVMFVEGSSGNFGVNNRTPAARCDITAAANAVGLNVDLDGTPGRGFTVTDSSAVVLFAVESDGETTTEFDSVFNTTEGGTARLTRRSIRELHTLTLGATSDTTTISVPAGARILGVSMNVNTAVTNDGDNTWKADWITGSTQVIAAAGTAAAQNTKVNAFHPIYELASATAEIRFTSQSGNFTAGVIEIVAYYEELTSLANV